MNRHDGTFTGVLLLVLSGLADTVVGLAMRPVLKTCAPVRSLGYLILRIVRGSSGRTDARLVPVSVGGAG